MDSNEIKIEGIKKEAPKQINPNFVLEPQKYNAYVHHRVRRKKKKLNKFCTIM